MSQKLLYATNNPGKKIEVSKLLEPLGIKVYFPNHLDLALDVPETGNTLEENAILKAEAFSKAWNNKQGLVLADDTGLEIDALGGQPGIHVRRWKDGVTRMEDEGIIEYCLKQLEDIPDEQRGAQFRTVLALRLPNSNIEIFDGILRGSILKKPASIRIEGFPFESLFYISDWKMLLGEAHQLKATEKGSLFNHRERALQKLIPRLKELL